MDDKIVTITRVELWRLVWDHGQSGVANRLNLDLKKLPACLDLYSISRPNSGFFTKRSMGIAVDPTPLCPSRPADELITFVDGVEQSLVISSRKRKKDAASAKEKRAVARAGQRSLASQLDAQRTQLLAVTRRLREYAPQKLEEARFARIKREADREAAIAEEQELVEVLKVGLTKKGTAQRLGLSAPSFAKRFKRAAARLARKERVSFGLAAVALRPRKRCELPKYDQGPYSAAAANVANIRRYFEWLDARDSVIYAQEEAREDDPFYDVRSWILADLSQCELHCKYTVNFHRLAWRVFSNSSQEIEVTINELGDDFGIKPSHMKSATSFSLNVLNPVAADFSTFGDFELSWTIARRGWGNVVALRFCPKPTAFAKWECTTNQTSW